MVVTRSDAPDPGVTYQHSLFLTGDPTVAPFTDGVDPFPRLTDPRLVWFTDDTGVKQFRLPGFEPVDTDALLWQRDDLTFFAVPTVELGDGGFLHRGVFGRRTPAGATPSADDPTAYGLAPVLSGFPARMPPDRERTATSTCLDGGRFTFDLTGGEFDFTKEVGPDTIVVTLPDGTTTTIVLADACLFPDIAGHVPVATDPDTTYELLITDTVGDSSISFRPRLFRPIQDTDAFLTCE